MDSKIGNRTGVETRECDECGACAVRLSWKDESFVYGTGAEAVQLTVRVPVWTCDECGFAYTEGEAEEIRHEAICWHLGMLTPAEIRRVREHFGLTQAQFAQATGFGI